MGRMRVFSKTLNIRMPQEFLDFSEAYAKVHCSVPSDALREAMSIGIKSILKKDAEVKAAMGKK